VSEKTEERSYHALRPQGLGQAMAFLLKHPRPRPGAGRRRSVATGRTAAQPVPGPFTGHLQPVHPITGQGRGACAGQLSAGMSVVCFSGVTACEDMGRGHGPAGIEGYEWRIGWM
jgi:hypothetical protein